MTYQQAREAGWLEIEDAEAEDGTRTIPMLKTYHVFHASQVDGIPDSFRPA